MILPFLEADISSNTNENNTVNTNTLEIKKVVSGTAPAGTTGYNFTLQLKDVFGTDVAFSNYANIKATKTGNATAQTGYIDSDGKFTLTAGQSLTIEGIPYGTKYKITETGPNDGAAITYSTVTTDENGFATLTSDKTSTNAFTVTNTYPSETGVDVLKKNGSNTPLEGAELELWYKETSTPPTYHFNDPKVVPYKMNGMKISKSPSEIGIPGLIAFKKTVDYCKSKGYKVFTYVSQQAQVFSDNSLQMACQLGRIWK